VVDAVILAAGRSSRMGGPHKLLATFDGVPLIRLSALTALASQARRVRVVVGHRSAEIKRALAGLDVDITDNPAFAEGLSTSVLAGCGAAFDAGADGALVILADQPRLGSGDLDRLIAGFAREGRGSLVAATDGGRLANPVVLSVIYRGDIDALTGDVGARRLLADHADALQTVEIGEAAGIDVDTPEAMAAAGGVLVG
jgi:molybdenum cofactor cytidylyltransferase